MFLPISKFIPCSLTGKKGLRDYKTINKRGFTIDFRDHGPTTADGKFDLEVDKTFT